MLRFAVFERTTTRHRARAHLHNLHDHLHNVNCQRADRMTMAHGLEARVPFLDPRVIDAVMKASQRSFAVLIFYD